MVMEARFVMGSSDVTLYAVWSKPPVSTDDYVQRKRWHGNDANQTITATSSAPLNANAFIRTGYSFSGWALTDQRQAPPTLMSTLTMGSSDVTLYAVWVVKNS
jgi:uncharacterized repeat protein (TIGR02543 family)